MNLQQSVDRILTHGSIALEGFYDRFFERHPQYRSLFEGKSMAAQSAMLTMALVAVRQAPDLRPAAVMYLRVQGARHKALGVSEESYPHFIDSLIDTIADFHGNDWTATLAEQWRAALTLATGIMLQEYANDHRSEKHTP